MIWRARARIPLSEPRSGLDLGHRVATVIGHPHVTAIERDAEWPVETVATGLSQRPVGRVQLRHLDDLRKVANSPLAQVGDESRGRREVIVVVEHHEVVLGGCRANQ